MKRRKDSAKPRSSDTTDAESVFVVDLGACRTSRDFGTDDDADLPQTLGFRDYLRKTEKAAEEQKEREKDCEVGQRTRQGGRTTARIRWGDRDPEADAKKAWRLYDEARRLNPDEKWWVCRDEACRRFNRSREGDGRKTVEPVSFYDLAMKGKRILEAKKCK